MISRPAGLGRSVPSMISPDRRSGDRYAPRLPSSCWREISGKSSGNGPLPERHAALAPRTPRIASSSPRVSPPSRYSTVASAQNRSQRSNSTRRESSVAGAPYVVIARSARSSPYSTIANAWARLDRVVSVGNSISPTRCAT
jgi:hypothetical protein